MRALILRRVGLLETGGGGPVIRHSGWKVFSGATGTRIAGWILTLMKRIYRIIDER